MIKIGPGLNENNRNATLAESINKTIVNQHLKSHVIKKQTMNQMIDFNDHQRSPLSNRP